MKFRTLLCLLGPFVALIGSAHAAPFLIAGWDFSQITLDGAVYVGPGDGEPVAFLNANYSDLVGDGAAAAAKGRLYFNGEFESSAFDPDFADEVFGRDAPNEINSTINTSARGLGGVYFAQNFDSQGGKEVLVAFDPTVGRDRISFFFNSFGYKRINLSFAAATTGNPTAVSGVLTWYYKVGNAGALVAANVTTVINSSTLSLKEVDLSGIAAIDDQAEVYLVAEFAGFGSGAEEVRIDNVQIVAAGISAENAPPQITNQPSNVNVTYGNNASFTVAVTGKAPLIYQWYRGTRPNGTVLTDDAKYEGATAATLTVKSTVQNDQGEFYVRVSNDVGSINSNNVALQGTAAALPVITTQPLAQSVATGASATFSVAATSASPLTYQWRRNGVIIAGATSATYSIASVEADAAGDYSVVVSNSGGSTPSNNARLIVLNPPVITTEPGGTTLDAGARLELSIVATGDSPLTYQWKKGADNVPGATSATLVIDPVGIGDAGDYTVVVSNGAGSDTSETATVVVNAVVNPPVITTQPVGVNLYVGARLELTVVASGDSPLTYQWKKGGEDLPTAISATLIIDLVATDDAGDYTVVVSNADGSDTSDVATVMVNEVVSLEIINLSGRADTGTEAEQLIVGFYIGGAGTKEVLVRAVGPGLRQFDVPNAMTDPQLQLVRQSDEQVLSTRINWEDDPDLTGLTTTMARLGAFPLDSGSLDAAVVAQLAPGGYTVLVSSASGTTANVLAEMYDADEEDGATARMINLSLRGRVPSQDALIAGFVVRTSAPTKRLLVRAVGGDRLSGLGVGPVLADPHLDIYRSVDTEAGSEFIVGNDDWSTNDNAAEIAAVSSLIGAFSLDTGSVDAALLLDLPSGLYTAVARGAGTQTGIVLVEVYDVP